jgi:hypothetical protein
MASPREGSAFTRGLGKNIGSREEDARTGAPNTTDSIFTYVKQLVNMAYTFNAGLAYTGTCPAGMTQSTTAIPLPSLAGFGDDYFNTKYYMAVLLNANSHGNAPEGQVRQITDYNSTTGVFTVNAFGANVQENDEVLILHESIYLLIDATVGLSALKTLLDTAISDVGDVQTTVDGIETEVAKIPKSDGAVSWNVTALAAIEGEVEDALQAVNLDHLLLLDDAAQPYPVNMAADSIMAKLMCKGDPATPATYDCTTDSLEMLSDKLGAFTGDGGADADDSVKALCDLIKTAVDAILLDTGTDGVIVASRTAAYGRQVGVKQYKTISVTAAANAAADTTLGTVTTQGCIIEDVVIHADAAQTAELTSCPVLGGAAKCITFIAAVDAIQANLDAENKQVAWQTDGGSVYLPASATIVMEHNGTGATALDLTVIIGYRAAVDGGYLA